jgi:hypothetical protein
MTAMRLKRYPSPSGGFALGKIGVGATLLKQGKTAKDYVQTGLVAMWDGIENAGWGTHDANATTWKDLINSRDLSVINQATWENNGLAITQRVTNGIAYSSVYFSDSDIVSIEVGFDLSSDFPNGQGRALFCNSNNRSVMGRGLNGIRSRGAPSVSATRDLIGKFTASVIYASSASGDMIYCDGVGRSTTEAGGNWGIGNYIRIGCTSANVNQTAIIGKCYFVRIYSRALTADEIAHNYAIDKERFNLP